jgi:small-conductance mechanosensitive channel
MDVPINCQVALDRHKNALQWYNLWSTLTYIFGAFLILILIYLVIAATQSSVTQSVIGLIGTIIDGAAVTWVVKQRSTAYTEEKEMFGAVEKNCPGQKEIAIAQRAMFKVK